MIKTHTETNLSLSIPTYLPTYLPTYSPAQSPRRPIFEDCLADNVLFGQKSVSLQQQARKEEEQTRVSLECKYQERT